MSARNRATAIPEPTAELRRQVPMADVPDAPEDLASRDQQPSEDGGVEQHPVHDDDQEDLGPEDFEEQVDAAAEGGFDPTDKYEVEREAERKLKEPGAV